MDEYQVRLLKLFGVLIGTIILFLVLLRIHVSFGIALFISMAFMGYGGNYVRKDGSESEEGEAEDVNIAEEGEAEDAKIVEEDETEDAKLVEGD